MARLHAKCAWLGLLLLKTTPKTLCVPTAQTFPVPVPAETTSKHLGQQGCRAITSQRTESKQLHATAKQKSTPHDGAGSASLELDPKPQDGAVKRSLDCATLSMRYWAAVGVKNPVACSGCRRASYGFKCDEQNIWYSSLAYESSTNNAAKTACPT